MKSYNYFKLYFPCDLLSEVTERYHIFPNLVEGHFFISWKVPYFHRSESKQVSFGGERKGAYHDFKPYNYIMELEIVPLFYI